MRYFFYILYIIFFFSCNFVSKVYKEYYKNEEEKDIPVARVYDKYLYRNEVEKILPSNFSIKDSTNLTSIYIDLWIKKQLKLKAAKENIEIDKENIEQRAQEYKYQLIVYAFEKKYINEHLDSAISLEDIKEYYENNTSNFELKQNIVRCFFLKIPKEAPNLLDIPKWLHSSKIEDMEKLKTYAHTYSIIHRLDDSAWVDFSDLIKYTPFTKEISDQIQFLKKENILQSSDSLFHYYIKILNYKIVDQISPMLYVKDRIKNILLNKRKITLQKELERNIYQEATINNDYEIY